MSKMVAVLLAVLAAMPISVVADGAQEAILPPDSPWNGASRGIVVGQDHPWITPFESSGLVSTPSYDETVAWLRKLVAASPVLRMTSVGRSAEGRDIWMVIASKDRAFDPQRLARVGKPTLLVQAGIHAGEIDGKDAGLMLLRDLTVVGTKRALLDRANLLFIPILNVDGHERSSPFGRINQRGPERQGWRTSARNLNLNRDYTKLDTEEMRAVIATINRWQPDLYIDIHVTDGIDYQYDITFGYNGAQGWSPSIAGWLDSRFTPAVNEALGSMGHVPGSLVFAVDDHDLTKGIYGWVGGPRFSSGYGDARHLATVLVENHSLKPYDRRVLGTYVFLVATLESLGRAGGELREASDADRARHSGSIALDFTVPDTAPDLIDFLGVRSETRLSEVSGGVRVVWTGEPISIRIPRVVVSKPSASARRPAAYWLPPAWTEVIDRLRLHGIRMERIDSPRDVEVQIDRLTAPVFDAEPFEGHVRVRARATSERRAIRFPAGSVRIPLDQPLGELAMILLEPASPDSYFQWGFFHSILSRTEYAEAYVTEPMAQRMLDENPALANEFRMKIDADEAFRSNASARLEWFYERTPYYDSQSGVYPVARELGPSGDADR